MYLHVTLYNILISKPISTYLCALLFYILTHLTVYIYGTQVLLCTINVEMHFAKIQVLKLTLSITFNLFV